MNSERWKTAQEKEIECWRGNQSKIKSQGYLEAKRKLWSDVLKELGVRPSRLEEDSILEIGCGPSGAFLLAENPQDYWCVDPLMGEYLETFDFLREKDLNFVSSRIEDWQTDKSFDLIMGFNAIDHVDDIQKALESIRKIADEDTKVILSVNVHNYSWLQKILSVANPILDPLHKHQHTKGQYIQMLEDAGFRVEKQVRLDNFLNDFNRELNKRVDEEGGRSLLSYFHPASIFFGSLELVGINRYGYVNPDKQSAYSAYGFNLRVRD